MKKFFYIGGAILIMFGIWFFLLRKGASGTDIEYRYATISKGELVRSTTATGVLVALTSVDVKSKAGGTVVHLAVDEGAIVKKGDLIAEIDPADTQAIYDQANADLTSAQAKAQQARTSYELQKATTETSIADARTALETAIVRRDRAKLSWQRQPALSRLSAATAKAGYDSAVQDQNKLLRVTIPQMKRDAKGGVAAAKADLSMAQADYKRQQELLKKGYVSQSAVDKSASALEGARSSYATAQQKADTLEQDITAQKKSQTNAVERAKAAWDEAIANLSDVAIQKKNLDEADRAVVAARIALQKAKDDARNNSLRAEDIKSAQASIVRSRVSKDNAKVQLNSTTVVAPRAGVVTMKYLEEGTIIPPGTSTFAQGTSIVQLSDTSKMYADCTVDEVDISAIKVGMDTRIILEAYPGEVLDGEVTRVSPSAVTANNMTTVKVRVEVDQEDLPDGMRLRPGMNANCEFIQQSKDDVLLVPQQAVQRDGGKTTVRMKSKDPKKPEIREIKLGEMGNDSVEVLSGLKEGEEVVVAELDMAAIREIQQKMQEAQQGGGLTGGGPRRPQQQARPARGGGGGGRGGGGGGGR